MDKEGYQMMERFSLAFDMRPCSSRFLLILLFDNSFLQVSCLPHLFVCLSSFARPCCPSLCLYHSFELPLWRSQSTPRRFISPVVWATRFPRPYSSLQPRLLDWSGSKQSGQKQKML